LPGPVLIGADSEALIGFESFHFLVPVSCLAFGVL
jgi:hypothetical protein